MSHMSLNGVIRRHRDSFTFTKFVDDFHFLLYLTATVNKNVKEDLNK
jgi:hypothetical protein